MINFRNVENYLFDIQLITLLFDYQFLFDF